MAGVPNYLALQRSQSAPIPAPAPSIDSPTYVLGIGDIGPEPDILSDIISRWANSDLPAEQIDWNDLYPSYGSGLAFPTDAPAPPVAAPVVSRATGQVLSQSAPPPAPPTSPAQQAIQAGLSTSRPRQPSNLVRLAQAYAEGLRPSQASTRDFWEALAQGGFRMAASDNPPLQAFAEGALAGLDTYRQILAERAKQGQEQLKARFEAAKLERDLGRQDAADDLERARFDLDREKASRTDALARERLKIAQQAAARLAARAGARGGDGGGGSAKQYYTTDKSGQLQYVVGSKATPVVGADGQPVLSKLSSDFSIEKEARRIADQAAKNDVLSPEEYEAIYQRARNDLISQYGSGNVPASSEEDLDSLIDDLLN